MARPEHAPTTVTLALPRTVTAPRSARRFAHDTSALWRVRDDEIGLDVVVSELVTNAVVHGGGSIRLKLIRRPREVIVEVYDDGPGLPEAGVGSDDDEGGRGLVLVSSMAQRWGVERSRGGKVVWCSMSCLT